MITIKLPYYIESENLKTLEKLRKQYSSVVRFSYNRFLEGKSQKDIRLLTSFLNNINLLNSWMIQCGIKEAESIYSKNLDKKVIFGSKNNFNKRIKGLISNSELKEKRILPIMIQGESTKMGNRLFKLNIINNNEIIFKVSRQQHIKIKLPRLRNNYKKSLYNLEQLNDIKQGEKGLTYSIRIDSNNIYISFEPIKDQYNLLNDRYIGIDLNPNEIGISIKKGDMILEKRHYVLNIKENDHNKVKHEIFEISKGIEKLFKKWNCKYVFIEDLTIKSKQHNKGRKFNKMINNQWIRKDFINNLEKRVKNLGGKLFKINPVYSSFIGNMIHDFSDPINASLEIGRRGYEVIILKNKKFYPDINLVKDQWKEYLTKSVNNWKEFFAVIKNSGMRYRISLDESFNVLSLLSKKSKISYYLYPN
jgi:IS605 OrfB family transposase